MNSWLPLFYLFMLLSYFSSIAFVVPLFLCILTHTCRLSQSNVASSLRLPWLLVRTLGEKKIRQPP